MDLYSNPLRIVYDETGHHSSLGNLGGDTTQSNYFLFQFHLKQYKIKASNIITVHFETLQRCP